MSQHDMVLDNGPGLAVRTDMNAAIQALVSLSSGPTEPTTKYAGQLWLDTSVGTNGTLRQRNQANNAWVVPSFVSGGAADLFFGSKPSPDRFVVNDVAAGTGTDVFTVREDGSVVAAIPLSFIQRQVKTATGAITLHADTKAFRVEIVGGGGGGGQIPAAAPNGQASAGTGGAGGAYASKWIIRPTGTFTPAVTIGANGASQAAGGQTAYNDGTNSLQANGGPAGFQLGAAAGLLWSSANPGQNAIGGDINRNGERGEGAVIHGANQNARSGSGGNSPFGIGGASIATNAGGGLAVGTPGTGYGAGGSGAIATQGGGGVGGGAGSAGVCIITEYR